jgi:hypothetical protein
MKKVLTGVSNNVAQNISKIKVWANSFKKHVIGGEVVLIAADMTDEDKNVLQLNGIKFFQIESDRKLTINDSRLIHTANWIENSQYDLFMVTDVFDVCFQADPFELFELDKYNFFAASEGVAHSEEPWNMDVMRKAFPDKADFIRPFEVICSGVMGGKKDSLVKTLRMQQHLVDGALNGHDIRDQAALNILIYENLIDKCKIFKPNEGWAIHCSLSGPTFQHIEWGLGKLINERYGLPKLEGNLLVDLNNTPYKIAHQYNRIPEWNEKIIEQYV